MEKKLTALTLYAGGLSINKSRSSSSFTACCIKVDSQIGNFFAPQTSTHQGASSDGAIGGNVALFDPKKTTSGSGKLMICMEKDWLTGNVGIVIT